MSPHTYDTDVALVDGMLSAGFYSPWVLNIELLDIQHGCCL